MLYKIKNSMLNNILVAVSFLICNERIEHQFQGRLSDAVL